MEIGNFGFSSSGGGGGGTPIVGGGTLNYICKFTPNGTTINNSLLYDDGTSVGIGTNTPDASALLDLNSTTQGFVAPRMTTLQRNAIVAPTVGLLIYNTSSSFFNYWDGSAWIQMDTSTGGDVSGSGTTNYAVKWTDGANSVIGDGTWYFSGNDYLPVTTGSNIGDATHRIGTIFMASIFDYANDLTFYNGTYTTMTLTTGGNVGIGISSPTAKVHIQGADSTSGNYALKVDNSFSPLLYVRNDGNVSIGKTLQIQRYNYSSTKAFWIEAEVTTENTLMSTSNADLVFNTRSSGTVETMRMTNTGKIIINDGSYLTLGVLDSVTDKYAYIDSAGNTTTSAGLKFSVCRVGTTTGMTAMQIEAGGNIGIGTTSPTARTHIQGVDATSSNYALKVDNSDSSPLLYVRNDGVALFNNSAFVGVGISPFQSLLAGDYLSTLNNNLNILVGISTPSSNTVRISYYGNTQWLTALSIQNSGASFGNLILMPDGGNSGFGTLNPTAITHIKGIDSTTKANLRLEPVTNVTEDTGGNTLNTTTNATVALETIAIPTDTVVMVESYVTCRKTGGVGVGTVGQGNGYIITVKAKNVGGVVTIGVVQSSFTSEDIAPLDATFAVSGTNIVLNVTGANNDNITWNSITKKYKVA
jgi:hypothetical protein